MVICLERGADLHMAQLMPLPRTVSCFSKIWMVLPFLYRLTRVVPDRGLLSGCVFVCVCVCVCRECLLGQIDVSASAIVDCPFANDDYCCESQLQEREVKAVCTRPSLLFIRGNNLDNF